MQSPDETFPVAACGTCEREVLTHLLVDPAGEPSRHCVVCDAPVPDGSERWVFADELDRLGYGVRPEGGGCGGGGCGGGGCSR